MNDTGMVRKVDDLGRIVLPVELRRLYGIQSGDPLAISVDGDAIVLRKLDQGCVFCGRASGLRMLHDRPVCEGCVRELVAGGTPSGDAPAGGDDSPGSGSPAAAPGDQS